MQFAERTFKDSFGATVIQNRLQPAPGRKGFEKLLFEASIEVTDQRLNPRVTVNAIPFVKDF